MIPKKKVFVCLKKEPQLGIQKAACGYGAAGCRPLVKANLSLNLRTFTKNESTYVTEN